MRNIKSLNIIGVQPMRSRIYGEFPIRVKYRLNDPQSNHDKPNNSLFIFRRPFITCIGGIGVKINNQHELNDLILQMNESEIQILVDENHIFHTDENGKIWI